MEFIWGERHMAKLCFGSPKALPAEAYVPDYYPIHEFCGAGQINIADTNHKLYKM
jgi:hypothetical protein